MLKTVNIPRNSQSKRLLLPAKETKITERQHVKQQLQGTGKTSENNNGRKRESGEPLRAQSTGRSPSAGGHYTQRPRKQKQEGFRSPGEGQSNTHPSRKPQRPEKTISLKKLSSKCLVNTPHQTGGLYRSRNEGQVHQRTLSEYCSRIIQKILRA